jgi:hypothetical protein
MTPPHFCDYLPFEQDLALYLNNLEFPLPKNDLYQVWLKLACWFWRKNFFNKNICIKYGFLYCGPSWPTATMMWTILNLHYQVNMSQTYFYSVVLEKIFIMTPIPFLQLSPLWKGHGPSFEEFRIPFTHGWFMPCLIEISLLVPEKKIFENCPCIFSFVIISP